MNPNCFLVTFYFDNKNVLDQRILDHCLLPLHQSFQTEPQFSDNAVII